MSEDENRERRSELQVNNFVGREETGVRRGHRGDEAVEQRAAEGRASFSPP